MAFIGSMVRMVLVGIVVDRLDLLDGAGNRGLGVAVLVADVGRLRIVEAFGQPFGDRLAGDFGVLAFVPDDRQRIERGLGVPPGIGDDGDALSLTRTTFLTPFMPMTLASS